MKLSLFAFLSFAGFALGDEHPRKLNRHHHHHHHRSEIDHASNLRKPRSPQSDHQSTFQGKVEAETRCTPGSSKECPQVVNENLDVVIIGAGAAGITAAARLKHEGWNDIKVIEANPKTFSEGYAGRLRGSLGNNAFNLNLDIGGEWIHTHNSMDPQVILGSILDGVNDNFVDMCPSGVDRLGATSLPDITKPEFSNGQCMYIQEADKYYRRENGQLISKSYDGQYTLGEGYELWGNGDWRWVDYTWFQFFKDYVVQPNGVESHIVNGCEVTDIYYQEDWVEIICKKSGTWYQYNSWKAIVTVSMQILKDKAISWSRLDGSSYVDGLPLSHQTAIDSYVMTYGMKTWLKCEPGTPIYPKWSSRANPSCDHDSWFFFDEMYGHVTGPNLIGYFAGGSCANKFKGKSHAQAKQLILDDLKTFFPDTYSKCNTNEFLTILWGDEKYVRTGYTGDWGSNKDGEEATQVMKKPLLKTVYFAGEAIPSSLNQYGKVGCMHCAALSGKDQANQIIAQGSR